MKPTKKGPAGQGRGHKATIEQPDFTSNPSTSQALKEEQQCPGERTQRALATACLAALSDELSVVLAAADKLAAGHGLKWETYDRLHCAHQHILKILAASKRLEVLQ